MNSLHGASAISLIFAAAIACCAPAAAETSTSISGTVDRIEFREPCVKQQCEHSPVASKAHRIVDVADIAFFSTSDSVNWSVAEKHGDTLVRLRISATDTRKFNERIKHKAPLTLYVIAQGVVLSSVITTGKIDGEIFVGQLDGSSDTQPLIDHLKSIGRFLNMATIRAIRGCDSGTSDSGTSTISQSTIGDSGTSGGSGTSTFR